MARKDETGAFRLQVRLDASEVDKRDPGHKVKVLVHGALGVLQSRIVEVDARGNAAAAFAFDKHPGAVRVILGPATAEDADLPNMQTIGVDVAARQWTGNELLLPPIRIAAYYWWWWLRWCRTFTIRGVLLCPDGRPVPGAKVCAYDVDWWWWWSSKSLIKCATTDASGAFSMTFTWCCGWWPWWWWNQRFWQLDPLLIERVAPVLQRDPGLQRLIRPSPQPALADFARLLGPDAAQLGSTGDCLEGVDYYEFKWSTSKVGPWNTMPPAANGDFTRVYLQFSPLGFHYPTFSAAVPIDGHHVYETLQHYEAAHPPADWGGNRVWLGSSRDYLLNWLTANNFADGTYYLQVTGYNINAGGHLVNPRVLKICDSKNDNYIVLTLDNRVLSPGPTDLHGNPCGPGTVHNCTDEPDTAIVRVQIRHADGTFSDLMPCGRSDVASTDTLEIDFVAHDHQGHLAEFELQAHYDVNLSRDLLALGTLSPSSLPVPGVPSASQVGPNYAAALTQGAASPKWTGGVLHLSLPATGPNGAFPETCCYQLRLNAYKRTIVDCTYAREAHANYSETSFTILV